MIRSILGATLALACGVTAAQTTTAAVNISTLRTGWDKDSFAIVTTQPILNPARCPSPDGYLSAKPLPGYTTFLAAALTAFAVDARVQITVHNTQCADARPQIIGVGLLR